MVATMEYTHNMYRIIVLPWTEFFVFTSIKSNNYFFIVDKFRGVMVCSKWRGSYTDAHLVYGGSLAQHWPEWLKQTNSCLVEASVGITKITTHL